MARRRHDQSTTNDDGVQDSFLDIVANIVGILILLVIVVGVRAAMQPQLMEETTPAPSQPLLSHAMVENRAKAVASMQQDVSRLIHKTRAVAIEAQERDAHRLDLATYIVEVEQALEQEKAHLDDVEAERLQVRSALAKVDFDWQQLMLQKVALATTVSKPENLVHTPTPLVRRHDGETLHLRVEKGRVAVVPFESLLELLHNRSIDAHRRDLKRQGGVGRIGPLAGFELHFALVTRVSEPGPQGVRQIGTFLAGEIRPANDSVGEPVEEAIRPESQLSIALKSAHPRETVVMVWLYPDSSAAYRTLKTTLRERGYSIDLRLLPADAHLSFSPNGRQTSAQ